MIFAKGQNLGSDNRSGCRDQVAELVLYPLPKIGISIPPTALAMMRSFLPLS